MTQTTKGWLIPYTVLIVLVAGAIGFNIGETQAFDWIKEIGCVG